MVHKNNEYVFGTAAEKIKYDVYEENKILKQKKKHRSCSKAKAKAVLTVLMIFVSCLLIMYRYAVITQINYDINRLERSYNQLRNENSRLKVQIEQEMNLSAIKENAEERLGMQKPDNYQIVYLSVPKYDYTVVNNERLERNNSPTGVFASVFDKVGKFIRYIY